MPLTTMNSRGASGRLITNRDILFMPKQPASKTADNQPAQKRKTAKPQMVSQKERKQLAHKCAGPPRCEQSPRIVPPWEAAKILMRILPRTPSCWDLVSHVRLLADCATRVALEAAQVLFREGETANRFYLIERGEVVLETNTAAGKTLVIDRIGNGDLLGWSWLFRPYLRRFTARASEATSAIFFYGTILRE